MKNQDNSFAEKVKKAVDVLKVTDIRLKLHVGLILEAPDIKGLARKVFLRVIAEENAYGCNKLKMLEGIERETSMISLDFVTEKEMLGALIYFLNLQIEKGHKIITAELEWIKKYFRSKYYLNRAKRNLYRAAVMTYGIKTGKNWQVSSKIMQEEKRKRFDGLLLKINKLNVVALQQALDFAREFNDQKSQILIRKKLLKKFLYERDYEKISELNCAKDEIEEVAVSVVSGYVNALYLRGAREIAEKFAPHLVEHVDSLIALFEYC